VNTVAVTRIIQGQVPGTEALRKTLVGESNAIGVCPHCEAHVSVLEAKVTYGNGEWEQYCAGYACPHCRRVLRLVWPVFGKHIIWEHMTEVA
jgi:hypothetical protein